MSSRGAPIEIEAPSQNDDVWTKVKTLSPLQEAKRLGDGKIPCARSSLLLGMGISTAISAVGVIAGRGVKSSLNWGVGSFVFVTLASYQSCRTSRAAEMSRMKVIIEDYKRKKPIRTSDDEPSR